uniref:Uncharacterized protein n=1 Tax=Myoviridae sp. ctTrm2 TaxID=2825114 RepID=A0A8S5UKD2_9CAUD|nr:MAG TPA: hypothetical protein [Myoviridae sp. ctTrm2]DAY51506.1 MAG TPA: hypothetical protein [Caudoviricetes sp.]
MRLQRYKEFDNPKQFLVFFSLKSAKMPYAKEIYT